MKVTFWGTRGSIAKAGPSTVRYGGNTSCVEIQSDAGTLAVIDCGTGAHGLGHDLMKRAAGEPIEGHMLISHTHWDHIQGLPFFVPLFDPKNTWHVYGPRGLGASISETLSGQMEYTYFPVSVDKLGASIDYHDLIEGTFEIGEIEVSTQYLNHPALTMGYRLEADGVSVVYSSDHEPHEQTAARGDDIETSGEDLRHGLFFEGCDLLIHDAQYLASEYPDKIGWGHSTMEYVVTMAHQANVGTLALYHHDPMRDDDSLEEVLIQAKDLGASIGFKGQIILATEGSTIEVKPPKGRAAREKSTKPSATEMPAFDRLIESVLIAVKDVSISESLLSAARAEGIRVFQSFDHDEALEMARTEHPGLILLESDLDGGDALNLGESIRASEPPYSGEVGLVVVTAKGGADRGTTPFSLTDWLIWPSSLEYVRTKLRAWILRRACLWEAAPLPSNEAQRIEALHAAAILDTPPEERFDRLTELASKVLDVPVALVSLVDDQRQWFKSKYGIEVDETPRDMAFCSHAILGSDVFQVPDALEDPRFAENPLVVNDPRVRFYAGVPISLQDGSHAGTFCVVDHRPRVLDEAQLEELRRLAEMAQVELQKVGHRRLELIEVQSPIAGTVITVLVGRGDAVPSGTPLVVLESMKMEHVVEAESAGVVASIAIGVGDVVAPGQALLSLRPATVEAADAFVTTPEDGVARSDLDRVVARRARRLDASRPYAVERMGQRGHRTARENIADLVDEESFEEYGGLAYAAQSERRDVEDLLTKTAADGFICGTARVNGDIFDDAASRCAVLSYDYSVLAGTQGHRGHRKMDRIFEIAAKQRLPIIFDVTGGGGRPSDTDYPIIAGLDIKSFASFGKLNGVVPLVSMVLGPCFAGNAALAGCSDVIIATPDATLGMGGPAMIEGGGLGSFTPEEVGPVEALAPAGVIDIVVADDKEACAVAKQYLSYFQGSVTDWECGDQGLLRTAIPENRVRVYDVRSVIETMSDRGSVLELRSAFGIGMVTALVRIEGRPLGVIANNPSHLGGAIDPDGADKATRFMQLCNSFSIPLVFLCDTPGFMVGPDIEKRGQIRHASQLFVAGARLTVPFFTVVLRKGYGLGAQAMAGGSFQSPLFTIAWPTAEFGAMGLEGAVRLTLKKELAALDEPEKTELFDSVVARAYENGQALNMAAHLEIDDVIDPAHTRRRIVNALRATPTWRATN